MSLTRRLAVLVLAVGVPLVAGCAGRTGSSSSLPRAQAPQAAPHAPLVSHAGLPEGLVPGRIVIGFRSAVPRTVARIDPELRNDEELSRNDDIRVITIRVAPGQETAKIARLRQNPNVAFAVQDRYAHALAPNDPGYANQYALPITGWDVAYARDPSLGGSPSTIIAIVDTGIDVSHPDLAAKILSGISFVAGAPTPNDDNGHGTHCAGIAAAITNNGVGIAGTNPAAQLLPVKVLDARGSGTFSNVANGVTWAADHGAKVISMSLGCTAPCFDPATSAAIGYAKNTKGALVVVAAGNDAWIVGFPGSDPNAMAIAASDNADQIAWFSNAGPEVSVAAPGVNIYSTYLPQTYAFLSGTSMSTPMVAGLAGLLVNASSTPQTIRSRIESTADKVGPFPYDLGRNDAYGFGRINVNVALGGAPVAVAPPPAPTPPPCTDDTC